MKKIRVGVIGIGKMGRNHARIFSTLKDVELIGVSDSNEEAGTEVADLFKTKFYKDYVALIAEKPDAISLVVPTTLHKTIGIELIEAGIDVLIEKPVAASPNEALEILKSMKKSKSIVMVGHIERFNPAIVELKKRMDNGAIGKIYKIEALRECPFPNRINDVGVVIDLAVHDIDIINYLTKSPVKTIYAQTAQRIHTKKEDLLYALMRYENGMIGAISTNWLTPVVVRKLIITGEKCMFELDYHKQELISYKNDSVSAVTAGDSTKINIVHKEPLLAELEYFIQCVKTRTRPIVGVEEGLECIKIAEKILESASQSKEIEYGN